MPLEDFVRERGIHAAEAAKFDRVFYLLRSHFRDTDPDLWSSWQQPYHDVLKILDVWEEKFDGVALATTKDTASAEKLLASTGREWPVFGKEFSEHKADQIAGIAEHFQVTPSQILFIDDLLENLRQVSATEVKTALAAWGYNLLDAQEEAREEGYGVVQLSELPHLFKGFLEAVH
jgi:phosphoglycolate phosphatase-like HAD superfamily hydrolase